MKNTKKIIALMLSIILAFGVFSIDSLSVNAASSNGNFCAGILSESQFINTISSLQSRYKNGEYWNKYSSSEYSHTGSVPCQGYGLITQVKCINRGYCADYNGTGCSCYCGAYVVNGVEKCWQCMGFAFQLARECFGGDPYSQWSTSYSLGDVHAGDIIRIRNNSHSIFVYKVEGSTIYYADCNRTGTCRVSWGNTYSYSTLSSIFTNKRYLSGNTLKGNGTPVIPSVTNAWVKCSANRLLAGETNTITFGADNAKKYNIRIDKDGALWKYQEGVSSGLTYTFNDAGTYSVFIAGHNDNSYMDSGKVYFTVFSEMDFGTAFYANIVNVKSGKMISADDSGNVILSSKDNSDYQKWFFERQTDGSYKITNVKLQKCLDVYNTQNTDGTNIQVHINNDTVAQRWYIVFNNSGYCLVPKCNTGSALDITGGNYADGTNIQEYTWNGTVAQIFSIDYNSLNPSSTMKYNGHQYEYYCNSTTWLQAYKYCEKLGGHLVTITSEEENNAMLSLTNGYAGSVWIGATDFGNELTWYWTDSEVFSYSNWNTGEPNNYGGIENCAEMSLDSAGKWNDLPRDYSTGGFICEYDDIVNPDEYTPAATLESGGYVYELYDNNVDWQTAKRICEKKGGSLATIYGEYENNAIANLLTNGKRGEYWIGLSDIDSEGVWKWVDGNAVTYENWLSGEPNNDSGVEEYIAINKDNGQWYDLKGFSYAYRSVGFICKSKLNTTLQPAVVADYNGHKYEYYSNSTTWVQAYKYCEKLGGHLVTITSEEENNAMLSLTNGYAGSVWIGATDFGNESAWYWVNSETFTYSNWNTGEPNNYGGVENCAGMSLDGAGKWNDLPRDYSIGGFICEYDDIVNPDEYAPVATVESGGYVYELYDNNVDWQTAKRICEKKGGSLATIYSEYENNVIANLLTNGKRGEYWIGLNDIESEGVWKWVDGNAVTYENWLSGEPNNDSGVEEYIAINKDNGQWYDLKGFSYAYRSVGFICKSKLRKMGDANSDGTINLLDAVLVQKVSLEITELDEQGIANADINGDGKITLFDAIAIQKLALSVN